MFRFKWVMGTVAVLFTAFNLGHVGRSPARFDFAKLESLNGYYIRQTSDSDLLAELERVLPHIAGGEELASRITPDRRQQVLAAMGEIDRVYHVQEIKGQHEPVIGHCDSRGLARMVTLVLLPEPGNRF